MCAVVLLCNSLKDKQQKTVLVAPHPDVVVPVASFVGPLTLFFWTEVVFTSTFPSVSTFMLETFAELLFRARIGGKRGSVCDFA